MNQNKIHIGTSGWNYNHWKGVFYPPDLPVKDWLHFYTERFHTVEINNTFYQLPGKHAFESWYDMSPAKFVFAVKANCYITHMKKLKEPEEAVSNFLKRAGLLKEKIGPVLFQLPPRWRFNLERLELFLQILPKNFRYTFEFRDDTWWNEEVYDLLKKYNAAFCMFELAGQLSPKEVTADFVYIRLHGPGAAYEGKYDRQTLASWAGAFSQWQKQGKEIFCYFDNDQDGYAAQNAAELKEMIRS